MARCLASCATSVLRGTTTVASSPAWGIPRRSWQGPPVTPAATGHPVRSQELIRDTTAAVRAIPAPPANMVLFRGAQFKDFAELDALAAADTITAPTFLSTSRDPKVAVGFSGGMFNTEPSVVYRIRKHRSGAALGAPYSLEAEAEVLFPPGTPFRVTGRQRGSESQLPGHLEEDE